MMPESLNSLVEELVERLGKWIFEDRNRTEIPDLLTFEQWACELSQKMGRQMVERFVQIRSNQAKSPRPICRRCHQFMQRHKRSSWTRHTPFGAVRVEEDVYVYCRGCRESTRPLHSYLGTDRESWSLLVQEAAVDLAADESCQSAVEKLERHHRGVKMGRSVALRLLHQHGSQAREFIAFKLKEALSVAAEHTGQGALELEVEYDGGMVPVATLEPIEVEEGEEIEKTPVRGLPKRQRLCRWEEVKVGVVQTPGEASRLYAVRPTGQLDEAFEDLLSLACLKNWTEETQVRGIADGARYIRTRMEKTFHSCRFQFILDRPHAKEHLSEAGQAMAGLVGLSAQQWASQALERLEVGQVEQVIRELRDAYQKSGDENLRREADYFERNRDAVAYAQYRKKGWSSASSEVESAHRHVVQMRLKIPGAWWHPDNVPNILALRMLKANGWWSQYWRGQRDQWAKRAKKFAQNANPATPRLK